MEKATTTASNAKSGLRTLKPGEILFNDGDHAESLYIIQKGQIRLFKPKAKGFIEIGVLRAGEVIGEMAFFDDDGSGQKRSCAASALTSVDVIEISFSAFAKTMQALNPWFKTIINTLASRLRKSNQRIRELEDNSASVGYGSKSVGYEFLKTMDVIKILGALFLVFKSHGESKGEDLIIHRKTLLLYTAEIFQIMEAKLEMILSVLSEMGLMEIRDDEDKLPYVYALKNLESLRQVFIYYNSERHLNQDKKLRISEKCELFISKLIELHQESFIIDIPNLRITDEIKPKFTKHYILNEVVDFFKKQNTPASPESLEDGRCVGMFGDLITQDAQILVEVDYSKVTKFYPIARFMNKVRKINEEKAQGR